MSETASSTASVVPGHAVTATMRHMPDVPSDAALMFTISCECGAVELHGRARRMQAMLDEVVRHMLDVAPRTLPQVGRWDGEPE